MITIVCGMHRSGTSAMAGLLHNNGILMGRENEFHPPPMKENPKGFFENNRFRTVNDNILRRVSYQVKHFNPYIPNIDVPWDYLRDEMKRVVNSYNEDDRLIHWGWKDPRTMLTIEAWLSVLAELDLLDCTSIILMQRPLLEISDSMRARGNKERYDGQFVELAAMYYKYFELSMQTAPDLPLLIIHFEDLIKRTKIVAKQIDGLIGESIIQDLSFVDSKIARHVV